MKNSYFQPSWLPNWSLEDDFFFTFCSHFLFTSNIVIDVNITIKKIHIFISQLSHNVDITVSTNVGLIFVKKNNK